MELLLLIAGLTLLLFTIYDFFFTTLSGSGAGFISKSVASFSYVATRLSSKIFGRKVFDYSGMIVNLGVLFVWIILVWLGLFLVYSYDPSGITNSNSRPANWVERLYYTGYVLSTLGLGNFKSTTPFFEIMTSIFSFFGFIFFTSSMTYLISVSSAVIRKRTLSRSIFNLGRSPAEVAEKLSKVNSSYKDQQLLSLQEKIDNHLVSHQAYPVVHFFSHSNPDNCFSTNFTRLDEAISILLDPQNEKEKEVGKEELQLLRSTMTHMLIHLHKNFSASLPTPETRTKDNSASAGNFTPEQLSNPEHRRELLSSLLRNEGFSWQAIK
ncbi:ion channel [Salinimicrobium xinjiangense]|uniref:ion channel n=1 Tax=Salinimicrobium xinjiangense TaxID=438596 RepID=UPI0003FA9246|nr:ion channel [Salinimicrobium xinjiangense]